MEVLVVRHGIALSRATAADQGMLDRDRPLTAKGRSRMKRTARGIAQLCPGVAQVTTSPFRRALETAEILRREYGELAMTETSSLLPDADPSDLASFLAESATDSPVAIVGHEPHLGNFIAWCVTSEERNVVDLRKGGACLLRFEDAPGPAKGCLLWLLPPSALRRLRL
ncbi:MAG TPA: histidine phosphatase family protein [Polyangiaceae bacterium]